MVERTWAPKSGDTVPGLALGHISCSKAMTIWITCFVVLFLFLSLGSLVCKIGVVSHALPASQAHREDLLRHCLWKGFSGGGEAG